MSIITYSKITTETGKCKSCMGSGYFYSKEHHNQLKKRVCYMCGASGQQSYHVHEDATEEVADLRRSLETVTMLLHQATKQIERLQAGLKN